MPSTRSCLNIISSGSNGGDHDNTFHGQLSSFRISYFNWPLPSLIPLSQQPLLGRNKISHSCIRCKKSIQSILYSWYQQYLVIIALQYNCSYSWTDWRDVFLWVVKWTSQMYITPIRAFVEWVHSVVENATLDWIDSVQLVNKHLEFDT